MSRALSTNAMRAAMATETGEVFLTLLTLEHSDLSEPIRGVCDTQDIVSRGETFIGCPFSFDLPADDGESVPRVMVRIDNVDREIVRNLRAISTPPTVTMEIVLASSPDLVEAGPFVMTLKSATYDALVIEGELGFEETLSAAYPADIFSPATAPGMFAFLVAFIGAAALLQFGGA